MKKELIILFLLASLTSCGQSSGNSLPIVNIEKLSAVKASLETKEQNLKENLKKVFPVVLEFPEVISLSPADHIQHLTEKWNSHAF